MRTRSFPRLDARVSEIGLGCWQIGGTDWTAVDHETALHLLSTAHQSGITMFDTADIYGDGRSERLIGEFLAGTEPDKEAPIFIASKLGRARQPGWPTNFSRSVMRRHAEGSLSRLGIDRLDLLQLHCVPEEVLRAGAVFDHLRELREQGLIRGFGASVESMAEAKLCMQHDDLASLQIIFNVFRQAPAREIFATAREKGIGLIVRLPLASGLLSGRFDAKTRFAAEDHREFNRNGEAFNVGETFAGLPFESGIELVEALRPLVGAGVTMAQFAQRWILDHPAVTTVITGASRPDQARRNAAASDLPPLGPDVHEALGALYETRVKALVRGPI